MADIERKTSSDDPDLEQKAPETHTDTMRHGSVSDQILKHSHDADEALKAVQGHEGLVLDEAANKRILRKIDLNLLPVRILIVSNGL